MKRLFLIHLLLIPGILIYAQQPKNTNTLLWRITGKGLSKPSYLYGTIHLTDKKVFFLGDSVYSAIDRSEGFAAELDLNSIGVEMINHFMREQQAKRETEPVKVKDVVSSEIWQRYKNTLADRFGKKAENVTVDDLDELKDELESEMLKKGDMPTFLDAHLFGLAKKKGKWVGGIEEMKDQLEHITSDEKIENKIQVALYDENYYRDGLGWFLNVYTNQMLDSIDAAMYRGKSGEKDYIMIKRNLKMAWKMDSISAIRSMFFAVGAAHLPGDSGVISLLRSKGFTVTPVISSKKIDPAKYVVKANEEIWFPVEIKDSAYFLNMPGIANKFEMLEEYGLNTRLFFDMSFMKLYMTMSRELGTENKGVTADSLFRTIKRQFSGKATDTKEKTITINGEQGMEFRYKTDEGSFVMQIFIPGMERMVLNAIMSLKEQPLANNDSKKFFESFVVNKQAKKPMQEEVKWSVYKNETQAFSIEFPSKPIEKKDVRSEEGKIMHSYQAIDLKSQIVCGLTVSSIKEGLYLPISDSIQFAELKTAMSARFQDSKIIDSSLFSLSGYPAFRFSMTAVSEGSKVVLDILSVYRGNRNYYLFSIYEPGEKGRIVSAKFLKSFDLLPINYPRWKTEFSQSKDFSTTSPFPFRPQPRSNDDDENKVNHIRERVIIYDTLASHSIFVDRFVLPSWYWHISDSGFLWDRINRFREWNDTVIQYRETVNGNTRQADFLIMKPQQTIIKKGKIIVSGNEVYELYGYLARQDLDKNYYRFFDDFKILKHGSPLDITKPKFKELEVAIKKGNKEEVETIKLWWSDLSFSENELPMLQSLMLKAYPDFDSTYYNTLNAKIIDEIGKIDSNHKTVDFIKANYASITKENNKLKPLLLSYLCRTNTKESYVLAKQILADKEYPFNADVYLNLYDSLELSALLYPEIFILASSGGMGGQVYAIATILYDSNFLSKQFLLSHEKHFVDHADKILKEKKKDDEVYDYYDLARILGILNTPASNKMLTGFSKYSDREMRFQTLIAMLKNNLPVDSKTIYTLASTDEYRYVLYEELKKFKKQSLFPGDYLSQEKLAYSKLVIDFNDEEYPVTFKLSGSKTITYKGKQQKVFLYKAIEGADEDYLTGDLTYYMAVAGPFSLNGKDYNSSHELTGVYWKKEFDESKLDILLKEYIKSLEEKDE